MPSAICLQCDYYTSHMFVNRECAAFGCCVENNRCGLRCPPLTPEERRCYYGNDERTIMDSTGEKDQLIIRISKHAAATGKDLLLQFMDRYGLPNLAQASVEQLREFCGQTEVSSK